MSTRAFQEQ